MLLSALSIEIISDTVWPECIHHFTLLFQVSIVKLKMDKDRKKIIDRRAKGRAEATGKDKGKYTEESAAMETS